MPQLYLVALDPPAATVAACASLLSPEETAARARFLLPLLGGRYAVAHGALRLLLGLGSGMPARDLAFSAGAAGKPFLRATGRQGLHFNLSHSENLGCIALSRHAPLGVDVELARPVRDIPGILRRILDPGLEHDCVRDSVATGKITLAAAMLICWTLKEAILKAAGHGFSADPRKACVSLPDLERLLLENGGPVLGWINAVLPAGRYPAWQGAVFPFAVPCGRGALAITQTALPHPPRIRTVSAAALLRLAAQAARREGGRLPPG